MRIFSSIVEAFVLAMLDARQDLAFGSSVALELISNDYPWHRVQLFKQLAKKSLRSFFVASALHQNIEHIPVLIHRSPEIVCFPVDLQVHAHPYAMYHRNEGDGGTIHLRRFARISSTTAAPFHR